MEYTALLAGQRFSDHPRCTHPAVAELARQVNDRLSNEARPGLARRAPALAAMGPRVPGVLAAVAAAALTGTEAHAPGPFSAARAERRLARLQASDRPGRGYWGRRRDTVAAYYLISAGLDRTRHLPGPARDRVLLRILDRALVAHPAPAPGLTASVADAAERVVGH